MISSLTRTFVVVAVAAGSAQAADFAKDIMPMLTQKCAECHSEAKGKTKGDFAVDRKEDVTKSAKSGELVELVTAASDSEDVMPPKGKNRLTDAQVTMLKEWVAAGAMTEAGAGAPAAAGAVAQNWTNASGKTIKALFDRLDGDAVVIKTQDGTYYRVLLASLDAASQTQAKTAAGQ